MTQKDDDFTTRRPSSDRPRHPGSQGTFRSGTTRGGDLDSDDLDSDQRPRRGGMGAIGAGRRDVGTTGEPDDMSGTRGASGSSGDLGDSPPEEDGPTDWGSRGNR